MEQDARQDTVLVEKAKTRQVCSNTGFGQGADGAMSRNAILVLAILLYTLLCISVMLFTWLAGAPYGWIVAEGLCGMLLFSDMKFTVS